MEDRKIDFLGKLPIFSDLNPGELEALARICDRYSFKDGNIIAYQRDLADQLYIVNQGTLEAFRVENGVTVEKKVYERGDYFDDVWLFKEGVHPATVRAKGDGEVWLIREDEFLTFIETYPNAILDLSESAWNELDRSRAATVVKEDYRRVALSLGEFVEYESRRTPLVLIFELSLPLFLMLIFPIATWVFGRNLFESPTNWRFVTLLVFVTIPWILLAAYRYLDWANDFLLITNKYMIERDFNLRTFQGRITKIPLDQVQSIKTLQPNWLETLLSLGSVRVTTASQRGSIVFDKLSNPRAVEQVVTKIRNRQRQLDASRTRQDARAVLEQHFGVPQQLDAIAEEGEAGEAQATRQRGRLRRRGARFVLGDTITYGRHWIVIFRKIWWILILMAATIVGTGLIWVNFAAAQIPFTYAASGFLLLLELFGVYYYYNDWTNDIFQLSSTMVIDIDRGPFGLSESRKTAQISNVQNVRTEQLNIIAALFDYGDVIIDTAGESSQIKFENVSNPNRVQADIFERREQFMRDKESRDAASQRRELALMFDEYQQLVEQKRILPRTPVRDNTPDDL